MVCPDATPGSQNTTLPAKGGQSAQPRETYKKRGRQELPTGGLPLVARKLRVECYDEGTIKLVLDAWRPSTKKSYSIYLQKWMTFCIEKGVHVLKPRIQAVCSFLKLLAEQGLGYGATRLVQLWQQFCQNMMAMRWGNTPLCVGCLRGPMRGTPKGKTRGFLGCKQSD